MEDIQSSEFWRSTCSTLENRWRQEHGSISRSGFYQVTCLAGAEDVAWSEKLASGLRKEEKENITKQKFYKDQRHLCISKYTKKPYQKHEWENVQ